MFWCVVSLYIFTRCLYFDLPYGLVKIRHNSYKYTATATRCLYFDLPYGLVKIRHNS